MRMSSFPPMPDSRSTNATDGRIDAPVTSSKVSRSQRIQWHFLGSVSTLKRPADSLTDCRLTIHQIYASFVVKLADNTIYSGYNF